MTTAFVLHRNAPVTARAQLNASQHMTRILAAEDTADVAKRTSGDPRIEGYDVEIARDGRDAFMP